MRPPLWLDMKTNGSTVTISPARCRNCGRVKVTSDPCSLDHLAAVIEFADYARGHTTAVDHRHQADGNSSNDMKGSTSDE